MGRGNNMSKRTMTLNLSEGEMQVLEELCARKGLNKTAVLRQALRFYQAVDARVQRGEKLLIENDKTDEKVELFVL